MTAFQSNKNFNYSEFCGENPGDGALLVVVQCGPAGPAARLAGELRQALAAVQIGAGDDNTLVVVGTDPARRDRFLIDLQDALRAFNSGLPPAEAAEIVETRLVTLGAEVPPLLLVGNRLQVAVDAEAAAGTTGPCLIMQANRSFGTGLHPSTRLAVRALEELIGEGKCPAAVLDVGTGSGILAMAAALFGAQEVLGIDICQDSLQVARENIRRNGLNQVQVSDQPLASLGTDYDLVFANVTASVLSLLAEDLPQVSRAGGHLIVSGLLGRQVGEMGAMLAGLGFTVLQEYGQGKWGALLLVRKEEQS